MIMLKVDIPARDLPPGTDRRAGVERPVDAIRVTRYFAEGGRRAAAPSYQARDAETGEWHWFTKGRNKGVTLPTVARFTGWGEARRAWGTRMSCQTSEPVEV